MAGYVLGWLYNWFAARSAAKTATGATVSCARRKRLGPVSSMQYLSRVLQTRWKRLRATRDAQHLCRASVLFDASEPGTAPRAQPGTLLLKEGRMQGSRKCRERLAEGYRVLEELDRDRRDRGDPEFGKPAEQRVVYRELLDLELQEICDQIDRICEMSGGQRQG